MCVPRVAAGPKVRRGRGHMMGSQEAPCGALVVVKFNGPIGKLIGPSATFSLFEVDGNPPKESP